MQLADLNSKPHGGQSLIYLIDRSVVTLFYPLLRSSHDKLLCIDKFHNSNFYQKHLKNNTSINQYDP